MSTISPFGQVSCHLLHLLTNLHILFLRLQPYLLRETLVHGSSIQATKILLFLPFHALIPSLRCTYLTISINLPHIILVLTLTNFYVMHSCLVLYNILISDPIINIFVSSHFLGIFLQNTDFS